MASKTLQKKASPGALIVRFISKKFDALRYLPMQAYGLLAMDSAGALVVTDSPVITGKVKYAPSATPAALATAGAGTITAAMLATGVMTRDCAGAGRADTTDTAANIITALGLTANYQEKSCVIHNISAGAFTSTLSGGTDVTLKGTITVEQNAVIKLAIVRTSATTVAVRVQ
jgi:hypothetical protein